MEWTQNILRFALFSTETTNPDVAVDVTFWHFDPNSVGRYDPRFEWKARGSHTPTFGGRIDQDYGFNIKDRKIQIIGEDMAENVRAALEVKQQAINAEWNFTDGLGEVFRVIFPRDPRGFDATLNGEKMGLGLRVFSALAIKDFFKNQTLLASNYVRYKYTVLLLVQSQLV